jgi:hypothetical protein
MEIKAKDASLWAKIIAVVVLLVGEVLIGLKVLPNLSAIDMIWIAFTVAGIFGTVDLNLLMEKITGRKGGV